MSNGCSIATTGRMGLAVIVLLFSTQQRSEIIGHHLTWILILSQILLHRFSIVLRLHVRNRFLYQYGKSTCHIKAKLFNRSCRCNSMYWLLSYMYTCTVEICTFVCCLLRCWSVKCMTYGATEWKVGVYLSNINSIMYLYSRWQFHLNIWSFGDV